MKKTVGFTIKDVHKGFFDSHIVIELYITDEDGRTSMGEYLATSSNKYKVEMKMQEVKRKYEELGYLAVGDWD